MNRRLEASTEPDKKSGINVKESLNSPAPTIHINTREMANNTSNNQVARIHQEEAVVPHQIESRKTVHFVVVVSTKTACQPVLPEANSAAIGIIMAILRRCVRSKLILRTEKTTLIVVTRRSLSLLAAEVLGP